MVDDGKTLMILAIIVKASPQYFRGKEAWERRRVKPKYVMWQCFRLTHPFC